MASRGSEIQLIIVDQHMPAMEAGMMASMFRRLNPKIPLLAISGNVDSQDAFKTGRLDADAFLQKPFTIEALCHAVHEILMQPSGGRTAGASLR